MDDHGIETTGKSFVNAVDQFIEAAQTPIAAGLSLADPRLSSVARNIRIPDINGGAREAREQLRFWRENPSIMALVEQYGSVRNTVSATLAAARETVAQVQLIRQVRAA